MARNKRQSYGKESELPIGKNEDVEFSTDRADGDDLEAQVRGAQADARQERGMDVKRNG